MNRTNSLILPIAIGLGLTISLLLSLSVQAQDGIDWSWCWLDFTQDAGFGDTTTGGYAWTDSHLDNPGNDCSAYRLWLGVGVDLGESMVITEASMTVEYDYTMIDCCEWQGSCGRAVEVATAYDWSSSSCSRSSPWSNWHDYRESNVGTLDDGQSVDGTYERDFTASFPGGAIEGRYFQMFAGLLSTYVHEGDGRIEIIDFTINGQSMMTQTEDCTPVESVDIGSYQLKVGDTKPQVGEEIWFWAEVFPHNATEPISYTWEASPESTIEYPYADDHSIAVVTWWTTGTHTLSVDATNDCGSATDVVTIPMGVCEPIHDITVDGPLTTTIGQPATFHGDATGTPTWTNPSTPITWVWEASGSPLVDFSEEWYDGLESYVDITWWHEGQRTVTATASNACSAVTATTTISVADLEFTPPFDPPEPEPPELNCECPRPAWSILRIGEWIDWLWCNLECWLQYLIDYLRYLYELAKALLMRLVNTILEWLWPVLIDIWMAVLEFAAKALHWLKAIWQKTIGALWNSDAVEWINCTLWKLGNFLEALVDNLFVWSATTARNYIVSNLATLQNWRDWSDFQWEELKDFVIESGNNIYVDWLIALDDFLSGWLQDSSDNLAAWLQGTSDALTAWLNHFGERLLNLILPALYTARGVVEGAVELFTDIKNQITSIVLGFLDTVVDTITTLFDLADFSSDLSGELITGFKSAINSESEAELWEDYGNLQYFWRGLQFFEDAAGDSPLAVLNLISLGLIGIGLLFWTIGQAGDIFDDISRL